MTPLDSKARNSPGLVYRSALRTNVEGFPQRCYNQKRSARFRHRTCCIHPAHNRREVNDPRSPRRAERVSKRGQVAQVVERSPEKAGVGGSTPSLATINTIISMSCSTSLTCYILSI
jgi:hypothetical protein